MKDIDFTPSEESEQIILFQWADVKAARYPALKLLHAIPNGGFRILQTAVKLKRQGVKKGVPDICLPVAAKGYHGLYIELKRRVGGRLSVEQKSWLNALNAQGYKAEVCLGFDDAVTVIKDYLDIKE